MTDSILEASSTMSAPRPGPPLPASDLLTTPEAWIERVGGGHRLNLYRLMLQAEHCSVQLYLVGGVVRDILLGRRAGDLDVMVEGPLAAREAFAQRAALALGWKVTAHPRFLTWRLEGPDGHLDLVSSRQERYRAPAQLPEVEAAPARVDLARRDFTVNSMAVALTGEGAGHLLDPLGGKADLAAGLLRVLHPASFIEDPTRILRGLRFAARLGMAFEGSTFLWLEEALSSGVQAQLTGDRLAHELELLLSEASCGEGVRLGMVLGIWERLGLAPLSQVRLRWLCQHPARSRRVLKQLDAYHRQAALTTAPPPLWLLRLGLLLLDSSPASQERILLRLSISGRPLTSWKQALLETEPLLHWLAGTERPSERVFRLERCSAELLALLLAEAMRLGPDGHVLRLRIQEAMGLHRLVKSPLDGHALQALGWKPGPRVREALTFLRSAALDRGWDTAEAQRWAETHDDQTVSTEAGPAGDPQNS